MLHPDWLERAWREFDVSEIRGSRHNPRILEMFKDVGHPGIVRDEVAWCAAFLGACLERTGRRSTRSLMARSYVNWGEGLEIPRIGAIAVLSRGRDPALGHVGFVVGETEDHLFLLGGNQSQRVSVDAFAKSRSFVRMTVSSSGNTRSLCGLSVMIRPSFSTLMACFT